MPRQNVLSQTTRKKPGPPATGKGTLIGVRLQPLELASVDAWIATQDDAPSRPEAIRRLLAHRLISERGANPRQPAPHEKARTRSIREALVALERTKKKIELALAAIARAQAKLPKP
jgi:hypothetical protein